MEAKRELITSFSPTTSELKRSSSIKLNREKTSLTNYFSGLSNGVSGVGMGVTLNFLTSNAAPRTTAKKSQPVSLRNNINTNNQPRTKPIYNDLSSQQALVNDLKPANSSISLENVVNGLELLLTDDAQLSKVAAAHSSGLKLVSNGAGGLLNRSKRSDELLVVESNQNTDEQFVEIKNINKAANRKSVEFNDNEKTAETNEMNSTEENRRLANRQRFNLINQPSISLLKKTKSFVDTKLGKTDEIQADEKTSNSKSKSIGHSNSSSHTPQPAATGVKLIRSNSRLSHVTRDINDSYAYNNVQQYIEENDLMPPEKTYSIRKWIRQVNQSKDDWEKRTVEANIVDS